MYGIFTYIWLFLMVNWVNVGKYTPYMDGMGFIYIYIHPWKINRLVHLRIHRTPREKNGNHLNQGPSWLQVRFVNLPGCKKGFESKTPSTQKKKMTAPDDFTAGIKTCRLIGYT